MPGLSPFFFEVSITALIGTALHCTALIGICLVLYGIVLVLYCAELIGADRSCVVWWQALSALHRAEKKKFYCLLSLHVDA